MEGLYIKKDIQCGPFVQVKRNQKRDKFKKEKIHERLLKRKNIKTAVRMFSTSSYKSTMVYKIKKIILRLLWALLWLNTNYILLSSMYNLPK